MKYVTMWMLPSTLKLISSFRNKLSIHTYVYKMDKAYLRHSKDVFDFSFHLTLPESRVNRTFNFSRKLNEPVSAFLGRVTANVEKIVSKKQKKKKKDNQVELSENISITASLIQNNAVVNDETLCEHVFKDNARDVVLRLMDIDYAIIINSPYIDSIDLPNSILANFPVYPSKFDAVNTNKNLSEFTWFTSKDKLSWTLASSGYVLMPSNADIDSYLKLSCVPKNEEHDGPQVEIISDVTISASPGECPFENRHAFTRNKCGSNEFRVITYNILADLYCDSDFSRTELYPYCPPYALSIDYRKQLFLKEILGYNADIICLQEVDRKIFSHDLEPVFSFLKFGSVFMLKGGQVAEGLACFYDTNKFKFLEKSSMILAEELDKNPIFSSIWTQISTNENLTERILSRTTALQTVALECIENGNIVLVANTHLYFHPDADHIRLLQGYINIRYIQGVYDKLREKYQNKNISIVFCGDFNSVPECGIYKLYTTGAAEDSIDLQSKKEESIAGLMLYQDFKLASACGTPKYTNFTAGFQDCLDYIYYDVTKLSVSQVIPLPTDEELVQNTALPSIVFPSDHISLVADFKFL